MRNPVYDSGGLEILTEEECRRLIDAAPLGRIVFTDRALPAIQPVNFLMANGEVIIRTSSGSKLAAAARNAVVAFEVDEFDPAIRTGWSVVIVGHSRIISEDGELSELRELPLRTWAPTAQDHFIAITPELISGRRLPTSS
ncbi:pyridoxamine 5'-phosphate oxidase family protein [Actinoallomurus soli]|uniref:pyridoxamine 5'-phosphate oxidase family protein n=1 Tax=Actinoallomurus soli TaxID=2952535 RepID=UPI002092FD60|nr:pyridoxamine 5'-phosphate oxidase family protein [Actinoallomurus soli]MCO5974211.1 pyridoxamine 5'-phosphate oxidase family protein [Actinoallomurus soli]